MRSSASSRPSPSAHPAPRRRRRHGRRLFCLTVLACCVAGCIAFALSQEPQTAASSAASQPAASSSDAENGMLTAYQQDQVAFYGNYAEFAQAQSNVENAVIAYKDNRVVMAIASNECTADLDSAVDSALNS